MENEKQDYIKGTLIFLLGGLLLSTISKLSGYPLNLLEGFGLVMIGVLVKNYFDIDKEV
jgi:hypothetical protein